MNKHKEALEAYDKALNQLDHTEKRIVTLNNKALVLRSLKQYEEALRHYDEALTIVGSQNQARTFLNKGLVLADLERWKEAAQCYKTALTFPGQRDVVTSAHLHYATALHRLNQFEESILYYEKYLATNPRNSSVHHNKGRAFVELGKWQEALQSFQEAARYDRNNTPVITYYLGLSLWNLKRASEIPKLLESASSLGAFAGTFFLNGD